MLQVCRTSCEEVEIKFPGIHGHQDRKQTGWTDCHTTTFWCDTKNCRCLTLFFYAEQTLFYLSADSVVQLLCYHLHWHSCVELHTDAMFSGWRDEVLQSWSFFLLLLLNSWSVFIETVRWWQVQSSNLFINTYLLLAVERSFSKGQTSSFYIL